MKPEEADMLLSEVISYLDSSIGLGKLYYPGSGWDRVPLETLGPERVYHVSLNENRGDPDFDSNIQPAGYVFDEDGNFIMKPEQRIEWMDKIFEKGYFGILGDDAVHRYEANFFNSPFRSGFFDSLLIWCIPYDTTVEAVPEFLRVTRKDGIIIANTDLTFSNSGLNLVDEALESRCRKLDIPEFRVGVYQNVV